MTMMKSMLPVFTLLICSSILFTRISAGIEALKVADNGLRPHWLAGSHRNRIDLFKKWLDNKRGSNSAGDRGTPALDISDNSKGCTDPSEPFQCPNSDRCIALQFVCDGRSGDCPGNTDENEETCIAAKRPAKENIEKLLQASHVLHGEKLFSFLFGPKIAKSIEEQEGFWFDALASAFSVSKSIHNFADKIHMSPHEFQHFKNVLQMIHDGRLEEIPLFAQEAVNQGLASLTEKLYESGFMDQ